MARIAGVTVERSVKGIPLSIRINLRKHPDIIPVLEEHGLIEKTSQYDPKFVERIKRSIEQADRGELRVVNVDELWK